MKRRFSVDDLVFGAALFLMGVMGIAILIFAGPTQPMVRAAAPFIYFGSAVGIGVGLSAPFQQKTTGGVVGFILSLLLLQVLAALHSWQVLGGSHLGG